MSLTIEKIKQLHDKAFDSGVTTREKASDDLVFYWITQWDDQSLSESQLAYRGEFNILRKAGRGIKADLTSNPIRVDFESTDESRTDAGETLDGLYRSDCRSNSSLEAFSNADTETIVCGVGAWELYNDYKTSRVGDTAQVIRRRPIYEAVNTVFWDPNARAIDKSDAIYVSKLYGYSEDGYKQLVHELTGESIESISLSEFASPETSYVFPWILEGSRRVHVVDFYYREKVKVKILIMTNPFGQTAFLEEDKLEGVMDDMLDNGYEIVDEKEVEQWRVTKYICSGKEILSETVIAGEHIPIVPYYGERAIVEGEEHYEGCTRLAKDPQRLRNFQLSYLADIASRSPRSKPIFFPEQIQGHEYMYQDSGADNNFPYLLQNRKSAGAQGEDLPIGPVATMPSPDVPQALAATIEFSRQAVEDVANPGTIQDMADPELSGKAVALFQARLDQQSLTYQEHRKFAHRRDGEIYASMAAEILDVPRPVKLTLPDGTVKTVKLLEEVVDPRTGDIVVLHDLRNLEFDVYSKISANFDSQKEQTLDRLDKMIMGLPAGDPLRNILLLKSLRLMNGVDFDDVRDYANRQLILLGIKKPETPEEIKLVEDQAKKGDQPSPEMVLAQAEVLKGQALLKEASIKEFTAQSDAAVKNAKVQVDGFNAQTRRIDTQVSAQEAAASIDMKRVDKFGKELENQAKLIELKKPENMSDEELFQAISA